MNKLRLVLAVTAFLQVTPSYATTVHVDERDGGAWISVSGPLDCSKNFRTSYASIGSMNYIAGVYVPRSQGDGSVWLITSGYSLGWGWGPTTKLWSCSDPSSVADFLAVTATPVFTRASLGYNGARIGVENRGVYQNWDIVHIQYGPFEPTPTCSVNQPASIDFKTMPANDIPTAPIGTSVLVTCTKNSKVSAKFVFGDGTDNNTLANGLNVKLLVGGWPGQQGFTYNANKDMPVTIYVNAVLGASGTVREGIFRTIGVVKLSYD
ncbi:Uncharacterised protein [Serratia quinivorans]|nr:Uncharacterised protein [Serratia quinivorans]